MTLKPERVIGWDSRLERRRPIRLKFIANDNRLAAAMQTAVSLRTEHGGENGGGRRFCRVISIYVNADDCDSFQSGSTCERNLLNMDAVKAAGTRL